MKVKREQKIKREYVPCFPQTLIITFQLCKCKYTHTYTFIYLPIYVCTLAECYLAYLHACIFATYAHYNSSRTLTNSIKSHGNTHANSTYTHTRPKHLHKHFCILKANQFSCWLKITNYWCKFQFKNNREFSKFMPEMLFTFSLSFNNNSNIMMMMIMMLIII